MRKQLRTWAMGSLAAVLTVWFVARTLPSDATADAAPPPPRVVIEAAVFPDVPVIRDPGTNTYGAASDRNLFTFDEPPPAPIAAPAPVVVIAPEPAPVVVAEPPVPEAPRPPIFPYRCLGRIGSLVVFERDREIVNVAVGETFGGEFVLRSVGVDAIEIGFVRFPDVQRVPIGG